MGMVRPRVFLAWLLTKASDALAKGAASLARTDRSLMEMVRASEPEVERDEGFYGATLSGEAVRMVEETFEPPPSLGEIIPPPPLAGSLRARRASMRGGR